MRLAFVSDMWDNGVTDVTVGVLRRGDNATPRPMEAMRWKAMRWDNANALWAICAPTAAPTDYGRKPGPPIHPIQSGDNEVAVAVQWTGLGREEITGELDLGMCP